ncbi:MAG TPA: KH domain-containing protein [Verrucomicrobiota bacterium]|nr:KH domain-containing protein [Verrucomicrobiota bacterium]
MQPFIEYVVKAVVEHPEEVSINQVERGGITVYQVRLHPEDIGRVIGKNGALINAIRSLAQAGAAKKGMRCAIEVLNEPPKA